MASGRFAPSPTAPLHLGNLRTALHAWLSARAAGSRFLVRVEDLDPQRSRREHEAGQLADLRALKIDWDGPVVRQSERTELYDDAIARLDGAGRLYPCYCTRREIREAASAPHGESPEGAYPGTCLELSAAQRAAHERAGRRPALRLRADGARVGFVDRTAGEHAAVVDDLVVRRNDGVPAYNLAVIVDDCDQGIEEVVRGADLLDTTPRQLVLARELGLRAPSYAHVALVLGPDGKRLSKRHGAVTLAQLGERGVGPEAVRSALAASMGLAQPGDAVSREQLIERFDGRAEGPSESAEELVALIQRVVGG